MYFNRIPSNLLDAFARHLKYDLVILQYGENVSNPKTTNYDFYRKGMIKSIEHIKASLPGVPILVISAHDRSVKTASGYQTSPDIPILVHAQSQVAEETGSAFWNLFSEMGGLNSMKDWVNASPALASKDYTHFTVKGAAKVGEMLLKVINSQPEAPKQ
jgi:lysophospholipase L1-like esterase